MTERKPHPDNDLIDAMQEDGPAPGQGSTAGGNLKRDVGSRSELHDTVEAPRSERPRGQDAPESQRTAKGEKTAARLDPARQGGEPSSRPD